ncbi:hypothetical protein [Desulfosarcina sp.]|uniref:hypothetical protein n=1 Tax=Desulfosarcina sp. TaxID=2027861 RepID=UPI0029A55050|nr:hypothetical protein [Desulfosarcina sp.]MDX2453312.1 hypothetical protein [Desulfosarcina sp.]MDX2491035.1 hypothetical protein [Desulfosarcina sp.]
MTRARSGNTSTFLAAQPLTDTIPTERRGDAQVDDQIGNRRLDRHVNHAPRFRIVSRDPFVQPPV